VLKRFRTGYLGKVSPVHLFWGSFDLAVTRFSGRTAPLHPGGIPALPDAVTREAYSHEVSSAGFWPVGGGIDFPAFYSYAYPAPAGFAEARPAPEAAYFEKSLGEFVLPYDAVRRSSDPEATLMAFLQTTYNVAAPPTSAAGIVRHSSVRSACLAGRGRCRFDWRALADARVAFHWRASRQRSVKHPHHLIEGAASLPPPAGNGVAAVKHLDRPDVATPVCGNSRKTNALSSQFALRGKHARRQHCDGHDPSSQKQVQSCSSIDRAHNIEVTSAQIASGDKLIQRRNRNSKSDGLIGHRLAFERI